MKTKTPESFVSGGGWNSTRTEKVRVKAWLLLLGAISSLLFPHLVVDWIGFYEYIPGGGMLLGSAILFLVEKPRDLLLPMRRAGEDLKKLY